MVKKKLQKEHTEQVVMRITKQLLNKVGYDWYQLDIQLKADEGDTVTVSASDMLWRADVIDEQEKEEKKQKETKKK